MSNQNNTYDEKVTVKLTNLETKLSVSKDYFGWTNEVEVVNVVNDTLNFILDSKVLKDIPMSVYVRSNGDKMFVKEVKLYVPANDTHYIEYIVPVGRVVTMGK